MKVSKSILFPELSFSSWLRMVPTKSNPLPLVNKYGTTAYVFMMSLCLCVVGMAERVIVYAMHSTQYD